jgi:hypothetical protein
MCGCGSEKGKDSARWSGVNWWFGMNFWTGKLVNRGHHILFWTGLDDPRWIDDSEQKRMTWQIRAILFSPMGQMNDSGWINTTLFRINDNQSLRLEKSIRTSTANKIRSCEAIHACATSTGLRSRTSSTEWIVINSWSLDR